MKEVFLHKADMPKSCRECTFKEVKCTLKAVVCHLSGDVFSAFIYDKDYHTLFDYTKSRWKSCPLKPLNENESGKEESE